MRNLFLFIALLFSISISFAQNNSVDAGGSQAMENYAKLATGNGASYGNSMMFYNPKRYIDGTIHLFEDWNKTAVIHTISDDKFLVKRVNLNLKRNSFEAKMNDSDSIFSFTFNNIKKIPIITAPHPSRRGMTQPNAEEKLNFAWKSAKQIIDA